MISPSVRSVYLVNVAGLLKHRDTKYCVCVSVGAGKYLFINTEHREHYDDFQINAKNYDFLAGVDRFLSCIGPTKIPPSRLIQKVGHLNDMDAKTMYVKIEESDLISDDDKEIILPELWKTFR